MANKHIEIKPLVIGLGLAGKRHLKAQLDLGNITGIYSKTPEKLKLFKKNPRVIVFHDIEDAMNWSNLVHVCTPDDMHSKYCALAMKKGKTILCEKPFTTTLKEAKDLQAMSQKHKSTIIVGQNYRLTPTFREIKKLISNKKLGEITSIETTYIHNMTKYRLGSKWRNMQDFLYVGGSHAIDLAYWLMNEKVVSVQAAVGKKIRSEYYSEERYEIILHFSSGVLGHVLLNSNAATAVHGSSVFVEGEKGYLSSHLKLNKLTVYKRGDKKPDSILLPNFQTKTIPLEVKIVNDYVSGKTSTYQPLPGIDEAVHVIQVLNAIQKATVSGKREVIA